MPGFILLAGGAEFGGRMAEPDRRAIELAGGMNAAISVIPAAAFPSNDHEGAGRNAERWFRSLGATNVTVLPLIDATSSNRADIADALARSRLVYMLGGSPRYLAQTLAGSASEQALWSAYRSGAVIGGSSAGAMALCQYYYDPQAEQVRTGLGLVPNACVLPHHNTFGKDWAARLAALLPTAVLIGIDERTGMLDDDNQAAPTAWGVYGQGAVTIYHAGQPTVYPSGASLALDTR